MIDPLDMNVPEIGKKVESIPVEQVMEAMQSLETELKEFYASQALDLEDAIQRVRELQRKFEIYGETMPTQTAQILYANISSQLKQALDGEQ